MKGKTKTYKPTGKWEVYGEWNSNYERMGPVLVKPNGKIYESDWEASDFAWHYVRGLADTYNMNKDKAAKFRKCPYCKSGCPWCGR